MFGFGRRSGGGKEKQPQNEGDDLLMVRGILESDADRVLLESRNRESAV